MTLSWRSTPSHGGCQVWDGTWWWPVPCQPADVSADQRSVFRLLTRTVRTIYITKILEYLDDRERSKSAPEPARVGYPVHSRVTAG